MILEVTMPVLGLTMEQGTIVAWLKEVGDEVAAGEPLFMVETDKATSDAPSPAAGILARILSDEGETVAVGQVIAYLAETAEDMAGIPAGLAAAAARAAGAGASGRWPPPRTGRPRRADGAPAPLSGTLPRPAGSSPPPGLAPVPGPSVSTWPRRHRRRTPHGEGCARHVC